METRISETWPRLFRSRPMLLGCVPPPLRDPVEQGQRHACFWLCRVAPLSGHFGPLFSGPKMSSYFLSLYLRSTGLSNRRKCLGILIRLQSRKVGRGERVFLLLDYRDGQRRLISGPLKVCAGVRVNSLVHQNRGVLWLIVSEGERIYRDSPHCNLGAGLWPGSCSARRSRFDRLNADGSNR